MLQKLRDKTSGWIATVILGLLMIPLAFFGVGQYMDQRSDGAVAVIESPPSWWPGAPSFWPVSSFWERDEITQQEFRDAFERVRQREREAQGAAFDPRAFDSLERKREVLESLIDQRLQKVAAEQMRLTVADTMVVKEIQGIPAFQVEGRFDQQRYQLALASQVPAQTPRQFEQLVREGLQQSLVGSALSGSNFVTTREMDRLIRLLGEKRDVQLLTLPAPAADTAPVSDADIARWYEAHPEQFRAPQTVSVEFVELKADAMPVPPPADEATLRARYEQEQERFTQQEERLVSHLLVEVPEGADAAAQRAAEQKASRLAAQAGGAGADFAALARQHSDDAGSREAGGDLGWVTRGTLPEPVEKAVYEMQAGAVAGPIKSEFGYHILHLREVRGGARQSFEEARESLALEQAEADRERAYNEISTRLVDAVLKNPAALGPAAREVDLPVQRAGPLARGQGTGVIAEPAVQRVIFSDTLIEDGTVSDPIEIGPNHTVLVRVTAHSPERTLPLAEVRERVQAAVRSDRVRQAAEAQAKAVAARVEKGETLEAVATSLGLAAPMQMNGVPRGAPLPVAAEVTERLFAVPPPPEGKASTGYAVQPDGSATVFAVTGVTPGDEAELPAPQREVMRQQIAQMEGVVDLRTWVEALRKRMRIEVKEANL